MYILQQPSVAMPLVSGCDGRMVSASDSQPKDRGFESRQKPVGSSKTVLRGLRVATMVPRFTQP